MLTGVTTNIAPMTALRDLLAGNQRFVSGHPTARREVPHARAAADGQAPSALILACVDSRLPLETLFDREFGQACVIRTAGHVLDRSVTASVELSVAELGVSVIVVLGHESCGAVGYALDTPADQPGSGELGYLVDQLAPAISDVAADPSVGDETDRRDRVMRRHVLRTVARLGELPSVRAGSQAGDVLVVGARYGLRTGQVDLLQ